MEDEKISKTEKRRRFYLVLILVPAIVATLLWAYANKLSDLFNLSEFYIALSAVYLFIMSAFVFLMSYLRGNISVPMLDRFVGAEKASYIEYGEHFSEIESRLDLARRELEELAYSKAGIVEGELSSVIDEVKGSISRDLAEELEQKYSSSALFSTQLEHSRKVFRNLIERLSREIESLSRRANLNLVIGVLTTCVAVGLLVYLVLGSTSEHATVLSLMSEYLPRVTVALFIEAFAFFFLRLYKSNLEEIKYYQEKISTISHEQTVYEIVLHSQDQDILSNYVKTRGSDSEAVGNSDNAGNEKVIESLASTLKETSANISKYVGKAKT